METEVSVDEAFQIVGSHHKYQNNLLVVASAVLFTNSFFIMGLPYILAPPSLVCEGGDCCHLDPSSPHNFAYEFDLVCGESYKIALISSFYFVGMMTGALVVSWLCDKIGRLPTLKLSVVGFTVLFVLGAISVSAEMMMIVSIGMGFVAMGVGVSSFVLLSEFVDSEHRNWYSGVYMSFWALGAVFVTILAWISQGEWRGIFLAGAILMGALLYPTFRLDESPRFLLTTKSDYSGAVDVFQRIAHRNGMSPFINTIKTDPQSATKTNHTYLSLCKFPSVRSNFLICSFIWFTIALSYYGMIFLLPSDFGNMYVKGIFMGLAEAGSCIFVSFFLNKLGRRKTSIWCFGSGGSACLLVWLLMGIGGGFLAIVGIGLLSVARFAVSCAFVLIYVYTAELFPTSVRSLVFGGCNVAARIGSLLSPNLIELGIETGVHPLLMLGVVMTGASVLSMRLEETLGKEMKDKIPEEEAQGPNPPNDKFVVFEEGDISSPQEC